ncbi:MAG: hypothetical protein V4553_03280 [Bacteroidota bacterium]
MDAKPSTNQIKQIRLSLFINSAMAIYAICTFVASLKAGIAWRILLSGTGSVFFVVAIVMLLLRLVKLRKAG